MSRLFVHLLRGPILLYRWVLSPLKPPTCRFHPTCSVYALEAIDRFGPLTGGRMALRRLCRCHPWGGMGYDPVPTQRERAAAAATPLTFTDTPRF